MLWKAVAVEARVPGLQQSNPTHEPDICCGASRGQRVQSATTPTLRAHTHTHRLTTPNIYGSCIQNFTFQILKCAQAFVCSQKNIRSEISVAQKREEGFKFYMLKVSRGISQHKDDDSHMQVLDFMRTTRLASSESGSSGKLSPFWIIGMVWQTLQTQSQAS